jgi:hypothetical protein
VLCELWIENPYYQYLRGDGFFQHRLPLYRFSMTNWRNRMGEERLQALLQESLVIATRSDEARRSLLRHCVDTTVQPKNITLPTDAKPLNRAREKLVKLAKQLRPPDVVSRARGTAISIGPNVPINDRERLPWRPVTSALPSLPAVWLRP